MIPVSREVDLADDPGWIVVIYSVLSSQTMDVADGTDTKSKHGQSHKGPTDEYASIWLKNLPPPQKNE